MCTVLHVCVLCVRTSTQRLQSVGRGSGYSSHTIEGYQSPTTVYLPGGSSENLAKFDEKLGRQQRSDCEGLVKTNLFYCFISQ